VMHALVLREQRIRLASWVLDLVTLDAYGTPRHKLPDCPICRDDELYTNSARDDVVKRFRCYRCSWTYDARTR
jgi:transposase-like protein